MYIARAGVHNYHTGVEINTCLFQTGGRFVNFCLGLTTGVVFLAQFQLRENNMPGNR